MAEVNFLVVEDSPTMRQLISFALKRVHGSKIVEASDGIDALKKISAQKFDLVLTDINMPIMGGIEFLNKMKELGSYSHIPIVIQSTEGQEEDTKRGMELGAAAYVTKPVQIPALHALIEKLVPLT